MKSPVDNDKSLQTDEEVARAVQKAPAKSLVYWLTATKQN